MEFTHDAVAFASAGFEHPTIKDSNPATTVPYGAPFPEVLGKQRYARPSHPEHIPEKLMR